MMEAELGQLMLLHLEDKAIQRDALQRSDEADWHNNGVMAGISIGPWHKAQERIDARQERARELRDRLGAARADEIGREMARLFYSGHVKTQ